MFKKLQKKIILLTMIITAVVLGMIISIVNISYYININNNAKAKLSFLIDNNGNINTPIKPPITDKGNKFSPEMPYEIRYFSVTISKDGEITSCNTVHIAAIDNEEAQQIVLSINNKKQTQGYYNNYKYQSIEREEDTLYVFLDCTRELEDFRSLLISCILIYGLSLLLILLLTIIFSSRAVKPFVINYQKQKQFITDASHEIKTPLSVIKSTCEVIEMESGQNEWTEIIEKQVLRLSQLTERLVFLSKMEEDNLTCQKDEFSLSESIKEVSHAFEMIAKTTHKEFTLDIEDQITMIGDETLIGQLVTIILDNAFKYSAEYGKIELILKGGGKNKRITVRNTISDFDPSSIDHFFDRFYRGDKSRSEQKGFGIGLSIAKAIVELHKGKITATHKDGSVEINVIF